MACAHEADAAAGGLTGAVRSLMQLGSTPSMTQISAGVRDTSEDELAAEMAHDLEMTFNIFAPLVTEDTGKELQDHATKMKDTLVEAVENAEAMTLKFDPNEVKR